MSPRSGFALVLAVVLTAGPLARAVCDLSCVGLAHPDRAIRPLSGKAPPASTATVVEGTQASRPAGKCHADMPEAPAPFQTPVCAHPHGESAARLSTAPASLSILSINDAPPAVEVSGFRVPACSGVNCTVPTVSPPAAGALTTSPVLRV
jgi:hypothetical protein